MMKNFSHCAYGMQEIFFIICRDFKRCAEHNSATLEPLDHSASSKHINADYYNFHAEMEWNVLYRLSRSRPYSKDFYGLHIFYSAFCRISHLGRTRDRGGGGAKRNFLNLKQGFSTNLNFLTPHGLHTPHIFPFYGLHILPFYGHFMDSTICTFLTYLHAKNTKYLFMDSTKVLVSTLKIRPGSICIV